MSVRAIALSVALLSATAAAAQSQTTLQVGLRLGNYYWVVETAADGTRRGGWIPVNLPLDSIDRSELKPLPPLSALSPAEQALAGSQSVTAQQLDQRQSASIATAQQQPRSQTPMRIAVGTNAAPVFVKPDTTMTPLRVAKEGSVLNVIASEGEWYRIEFQDPQWGRKVGYIEKRHVSVQMAVPRQEPIDLSIAESSPTAPYPIWNSRKSASRH